MEDDEELSDITCALNQSGAFLQIHVMEELKKKQWKLDTEHTVELAPFIKDPMRNKRFFHEEEGWFKPSLTPRNIIMATHESQNKLELEETSIDVIGEKEGRDYKFKLCIECKKLDPDYSDWIFFPSYISKQQMNLITKSQKNIGFVNLLKILGTTRYSDEINLNLTHFKNWEAFKHIFSNFGIAISNKKFDKKGFQSRKTKVDEATRQIIKGTYGYIVESILTQVTNEELYGQKPEIYVPIVVTSANLKICHVDPKTINSEKGHLIEEPKYENVDSIVCECGSPKSVRFPKPQFMGLRVEHKKSSSNWEVLIMSPKGFVQFLEKLESTELVYDEWLEK